MAAAEPALTGSCRCGQIKYTSKSLPKGLSNCHCFTCRRISGAPFLPFAEFPASDITWISKNTRVETKYSDAATRSHCSACGSPMTYEIENRISITAATIDDESVKGKLPKLSSHIFLKEKADWYELPDDGLERFEEFPPGRLPMINTKPKL